MPVLYYDPTTCTVYTQGGQVLLGPVTIDEAAEYFLDVTIVRLAEHLNAR